MIGLINDEAKQDFWGVMQTVATLGYRGVEGPAALLEGDVQANPRRFHGLGLQVITVSASREELRDDRRRIMDAAEALQAPHVSVWWGPCVDREELLRDAELYDEAGAELAARGLKLCYHNHEDEFRTVYDGVYALDILAARTDPRHVHFELDIAWITFGGEDPARVLRRMAGRVPAIHVKDLYDLGERGKFTAVGTGLVKVEEALRAAAETGVEWVVVEQDMLRNLTALETITLSSLYLKETGLV